MNNTFTKKEIVLTFDDGYANNFHTVGQIMKEYNLPYTVFISTEHIETGELFPTSIARLIVLGSELKKISIPSLRNVKYDISTQELKMVTYSIISGELKIKPLNEVRQIVQDLKNNVSNTQYKALADKYKSVKPMTWDMVIKLHKMGAKIGSHCMYHICCHENQDISEVKKQISESKTIIENKLQSKCDYFAYPNGDYTDNSNRSVLDAGYKMGFSTNCTLRIDHFHHLASVPRIGVQRRLDTFKIHIGLYPNKARHT
jgi:peptidoglycan/xylan/chitin deacetylase (PgdA/CDA1 family)